MAPNDPGAPARGRHSQQAVKQRQAADEARLKEERAHAREALRAAQERGDISIPRSRRPRKGLIVFLVLIVLAAAAFFARAQIADFARNAGIPLPFLAPAQTQEAASSENAPVASSGAGSAGASSTQRASSTASHSASTSSAAASSRPVGAASAFDIAEANLAGIPRTEAFGGFSLDAEAEAPIPSPTAREAIGAAYAAIEESADCAFVILNLKTGRGMCYNSGTPVYSASAFKAPYAYYLLANAEQGALLSEDDRGNLEAALVDSDNDAYDALHYAHDTQDYYDWLASRGITSDPAESFYPRIDAATMAQLWCETYLYLESNSDEAAWLKDALGRASVSFIRNGLSEGEGEAADSGIKVWSKGGWISDEDGTAVNDAGIVQDQDGNEYVMVVLTSQDNGGEAQQRVATLARALFDARGALA